MAYAITLIRTDRVTAVLSDHPEQARARLWIEVTLVEPPQPHRHLSAIRATVLDAARSAIEQELRSTDRALNPMVADADAEAVG